MATKKIKKETEPFYITIANQLIEQLEQGTAPWQKPWKAGVVGDRQMPINPVTNKRYRGINAISLMMAGGDDNRWMTYKQAQSIGAQVRKGCTGMPVQYWQFQEEQIRLDGNGKPVLDANGKPEKITVKLERPRVFFATVFNGSQMDNLPPLPPLVQEPLAWDPIERAETIIANSGAIINHAAGNRAFYRPSTDAITLPEKTQFPTPEAYYATKLHELGHWTGHESRLARDLSHPFGSAGYAKEELRAEIASMMLGMELGIGHDPGQHAAYVKSWIKVLQDDPKEILRAAADSEKILGHVMGYEQKQEQQIDQAQSVLATDIANIKYLVCNDNTLCYREQGTPMLGVLASNQNGRDWKNGPFLPGSTDVLRVATVQDFETFRVMLPPDMGLLQNIELTQQTAQARTQQTIASLPHELTLSQFMEAASAQVLKNHGRMWQVTLGAYSAFSDEPHPRGALADVHRAAVNNALFLNDPKNDASLFEASGRPSMPSDVVLADYPQLQVMYADVIAMASLEREQQTQEQEHSQAAHSLPRVQVGPNAESFTNHNAQVMRDLADRMQITGLIEEQFAQGKTVREVQTLLAERITNIALEDQGGFITSVRATLGIPSLSTQEGIAEFNAWLKVREERQGQNQQASQSPQIAPATQEQHSAAQKIYLTASYEDRKQAKEAGAKWDRSAKSWYITADQDQQAFARWMPTPESIQATKYQVAARELESYVAQQIKQEVARLQPSDEALKTVMEVESTDPAITQHLDNHPDAGTTEYAAVRELVVYDNIRLHTIGTASIQPFAASIQAPQQEERIYLAVPYPDRKQAQAAGAKWDAAAKSWYVGPKGDMEKLSKWGLDEAKQVQGPALTPEQEFRAVMLEEGVEPPQTLEVGKWARAKTPGDTGTETSATYRYFEDGKPNGQIENHRAGTVKKWSYTGYHMSDQEKAQLHATAADKQAKQHQETEAKYEHSAEELKARIPQLKAATDDIVYLQNKGVKAHIGLMKNEYGNAVILAQDVEGRIWTSQTVYNDGNKRYQADSRKSGCFHVLGAEPGKGVDVLAKQPVIIIGEGYATMATLAEASNQATVAVFDSSNIKNVAAALRERFPDKPMLIAGDDDCTHPMTLGRNTGRDKATEAAKAVNAAVVFPTFAPGEASYPDGLAKVTPEQYRAKQITPEQEAAIARMKQYSDFNDLGQKSRHGLSGVQMALRSGIAQAHKIQNDLRLNNQQAQVQAPTIAMATRQRRAATA